MRRRHHSAFALPFAGSCDVDHSPFFVRVTGTPPPRFSGGCQHLLAVRRAQRSRDRLCRIAAGQAGACRQQQAEHGGGAPDRGGQAEQLLHLDEPRAERVIEHRPRRRPGVAGPELDVLDGPAQREATHRRDLLQLQLEVGRASLQVTGKGEADVQRGGAWQRRRRESLERKTCAGEGDAHSLHAAAAALLHPDPPGRARAAHCRAPGFGTVHRVGRRQPRRPGGLRRDTVLVGRSGDLVHLVPRPRSRTLLRLRRRRRQILPRRHPSTRLRQAPRRRRSPELRPDGASLRATCFLAPPAGAATRNSSTPAAAPLAR
mmetsp:Transcript_32947/g.103590  ORF Transcript_32947/g.103590 Transcript_32947/m.103590 type:complete len:317 (+) Transcript_32947:154-1104(+)